LVAKNGIPVSCNKVVKGLYTGSIAYGVIFVFYFCKISACVLQSAQAISKLSEVLGESMSSYHHILLQALMKEVPGRLWEVGRSFHELLERECTKSKLL
jgi:hypothetical protein